LATIILSCGQANADFAFGEPVNLKSVIPVIDTAQDFIDCVSYDGLEMYVDSLRPGGQGGIDMWVLRRNTRDQDWDSPINLGPIVNSTSEDATACISADGLSLYFQSNRPGGYGRLDLYITTRASISDGWGPPVNLGPKLNSDLNEAWPWITSDDLTLYFHAYNRTDGYGRADIYVARRETKDALWSQAVNLGLPVNTAEYNESGACTSSDERLLFFSEDITAPFRPHGYGGGDMWLTKRASEFWQAPVNLGPKVNKLSSDFGPRISPNGRMLYFVTMSNDTYDGWQSPIVPIVDFNGDGNLNINDLARLINHWSTNVSLCDIGPMPWGDGIVDRADLEVLMSYWGQLINDPTLIAHWALDETEGTIAADSTGKYNGTVSEEPLWRPDGGMVEGALELDGIDDYIGTAYVLNPTEIAFSVFAWVKGGSPGQVILSQQNGVNWLLADSTEGNLMTELKGQGRSSTPLASQAVIINGNWHRIGFVWDGLYRYLYVDGAEVARDVVPLSDLQSAGGGLYLGTGSTLAPDSFFSGLIDDVQIYDRVITP
jgi:hypothetical protein